MTLAPRPDSTAADLMRLLCAWLAVVLLMQGLAAGLALGLGPLHRHASVAAHARAHAHAHAQAGPHHDNAERHHHRADDASVRDAQPASDSAALALVAALALMACASLRTWCERRRHVWSAATTFAWRSTALPPLLRPPRLG